MKILVVEDDLVSRKVLTVQLQKQGHSVESAADGSAGFAKFQEFAPHVVITDWMMPECDGPTLCRRIRELRRPAYPYLIILTALSRKNDFLGGMDAGADDFLTKPCDPEELRARLRVAERILDLQGEVIRLSGMLPICSSCKQIRDDEGYWMSVEKYIEQHIDVKLTHGICPGCMEKLYPEYHAKINGKY